MRLVTNKSGAGAGAAGAATAVLPAAVVVVDPISSGAVLALLAQQRGLAVVAVYRCVVVGR